MRTDGIIFLLFSLVFQVWANQDNTSNEILVGQPINTDLINETSISIAENTLYQDVVTLTQLYAPSSILDLIDNFQNENFWELTKLQFWRWISSVMGYVYERDDQERSGQKISNNEPLLTIPYFNYPITQQQIEGFLLDSWAVYRRWQPSE
jgi:hypothetical protein